MLSNNTREFCADSLNKIEPYYYENNILMIKDQHYIDQHQIDQHQKHFNLGLDNTYKIKDNDFLISQYSGKIN